MLNNTSKVVDHLLERDNSRRCFNSTDTSGLARAKEAKARVIQQQNCNVELLNRVNELSDLVHSLVNKLESK